jgi:hypothetical protein
MLFSLRPGKNSFPNRSGCEPAVHKTYTARIMGWIAFTEDFYVRISAGQRLKTQIRWAKNPPF